MAARLLPFALASSLFNSVDGNQFMEIKAHSNLTSAGDKTNVNGGVLSTCSSAGTAMTGFMRDGTCVDTGDDDAGSHHICIKMKSDFCTVTGQSNWCEEQANCMTADGTESATEMCDIENWCVCQWAFAGYLKEAKDKGQSCADTLDLECSATNMAALTAYTAAADPDAD